MKKKMKIIYEREELESIINVLRDIDQGDLNFWKQRYFYAKTPEEKAQDDQEQEKAKEKARELLRNYNSEPSFETAKPFISYAILDTNITYSLKKLREMIYLAANVSDNQIRDRLVAQQSILEHSGVSIKIKPLEDKISEEKIKAYLKEHYENYNDLKVERDGNEISRMIFTNTFWADRIPCELITQKGKGKIEYREDRTLREILNENGLVNVYGPGHTLII